MVSSRRLSDQAGFSLIELAIVLLLIGIVAAGSLAVLSSVTKRKQQSDTRNALELVTANLVLYVSRSYRLPCPADGASASGAELRDSVIQACTALSTGVVPWLTLGLAESDVLDGWGNRLTFRVAPELVQANAMNFSACDPAGTSLAVGAEPYQVCNARCAGALANCTPIGRVVVNKGLTVRNQSGVVLTQPAAGTGAAFVLLSHGENGHGAFNTAGVLQTGTGYVGTDEVLNANNQPLRSFYVADTPNLLEGAGRFDDLVTFKSVHALSALARLDARSH